MTRYEFDRETGFFVIGLGAANAVTSITGTAGQITASAATGAVTLSIPSTLTGIHIISAPTDQDLVLRGGTGGLATLTITAVGESILVNDASGLNTLALKNTNVAGYSGLAIRDSTGQEKIAFAFGNASAVGACFVGEGYIEASNALGFTVVTNSNTGVNTRWDVANGDLIMYGDSGSINTKFGTQLFKIARSTGIVTMAGAALHADGTSSLPSIAFSSQTGLGFYSAATNTIGFVSAGVESARFTRDTTGGGLDITAIGTNQSIVLTGTGSGAIALVSKAALSAKITTYNGILTAGWGTSVVQADGNIAATTNARSAAVATYTVGAADGTFVVGGSINITTSTTFSFSLDCVYTDDGNVSRTLVLPLTQLSGTFVATGLATNILGAGPYESAAMTIRCKASTSITIRPSSGGTYTAVVYNVAANIRQVG